MGTIIANAPKTRPLYYNISINIPDTCLKSVAKATEKGPYTISRSNVEDAGVIDDSNIGIHDVDGDIGISIYPNPVRESLVVSIKSLVNSNTVLQITNALGQIVFTSRKAFTNNHHMQSSLTIDVSTFPNGMYYLRFDGVAKKFVVNK